LRNKGRFVRRLRHESVGRRSTLLILEGHKYYCWGCNRYFNQRFPGVLPYYRSTEGFRREVFWYHNEGISQKSLCRSLSIGSATVERWYKDLLARRMAERQGAPCPRVIGIDEHFFTHKAGYATTFCDLRRHRVFDVALGRSREALRPYLMKLGGRKQVQVVVMDLADSYRRIVKGYFPSAKIVADRFHVIRLVNHHFMSLWRQIDPEAARSYHWVRILRKHNQNLTPKQHQLLGTYFRQCPAIVPIYDFKQKLCRLLSIKRRTRRQCRHLIPRFLHAIEDLRKSGFDQMCTLANTLESWSEEIVRMWRFTKTNSITEGFHTKMEMISRRAYGFRNFENYRLRVRALCS